MSKAPKPMGLYPSVRRAGDLLFISGVGARDPKTDGVPGLTVDKSGNYVEFDFEAQCHQVFKNVKTILEENGAKWEDLIDVTTFLVDMRRDFKTYNKVYAEYFKEVMPCRTTVGIDSLPSPIAIELKCVAYLGE